MTLRVAFDFSGERYDQILSESRLKKAILIAVVVISHFCEEDRELTPKFHMRQE